MDQASISATWARRLLLLALVVVLSACQSTETRRAGGLIGSVAGSIGGSYLGSYLGDTPYNSAEDAADCVS